jgi:hypothetical protein
MIIRRNTAGEKPGAIRALRIAAVAFACFVALGGTISALRSRGAAISADPRGIRSDSLRAVVADSIARARQDSINRSLPGYVVDSILPLDEEIRRFRVGLPDGPAQLQNGAASRNQLVRAFAKAVEHSDTAALERLVISRAEFAYLIYPESPYTREPYDQSPALVWMAIQNPSLTGARRLLQRFGGTSFGLQAVECPLPPERQGANRLWSGCTVLVATDSTSSVRRRLFGTIVERDGRFKFVSYRNDL